MTVHKQCLECERSSCCELSTHPAPRCTVTPLCWSVGVVQQLSVRLGPPPALHSERGKMVGSLWDGARLPRILLYLN